MTIEVQTDDRIRLVSSVLLLTKFADENSTWYKPHALKARTLEYLAGAEDHPCAAVSRYLAQSHWMSAFYCYAVLLGGPSQSFALGECAAENAGVVEGLTRFREVVDAFDTVAYPQLLRRFYEDTKIQQFWDQSAELWIEVQRDCESILDTSGIDSFSELLFGVPDCRMCLVPNPVDPPSFGFGPSDGTTAYCILGPPNVARDRESAVTYGQSEEYVTNAAFHEFAHTAWSKVREKYPSIVDQTLPLQHKMALKGYFPEMYDTWSSRLDEIVIRAATALYVRERQGDACAQAFLDREKREYGIDLVERIYFHLRDHLHARKSGCAQDLAGFLPEITARLLGG